LLPEDPGELCNLLDRFVLAKALYELVYELNNRPDWVRIPLAGILELMKQINSEPVPATESVLEPM
jgi:maltose alpha-D-glucosyltransferase/alpha-amylase